MLSVLITSAGGLVGIYLLKHLKLTHPELKLIGVDISINTAAPTFADDFYIVPPTNEENFIPEIMKIIEKEKIDALLPISSYDMSVFSKTSVVSAISNTRAKMIVMDECSYQVMFDKKSCYRKLSEFEIRTPTIYESSDIVYPCMLKSCRGTGSRGMQKIENHEELLYWREKIKDGFLSEYIDGKEYTVDCLFRPDGTNVGFNVRERLKTVGGGATVSQNAYGEDVSQIIKGLEQYKKIVGPLNFQYRKTKQGEKVVFDINTRLPSGGLALTVKSGFDIPFQLIQMTMGETIQNWKCDGLMNGLTMIRIYDEIYR